MALRGRRLYCLLLLLFLSVANGEQDDGVFNYYTEEVGSFYNGFAEIQLFFNMGPMPDATIDVDLSALPDLCTVVANYLSHRYLVGFPCLDYTTPDLWEACRVTVPREYAIPNIEITTGSQFPGIGTFRLAREFDEVQACQTFMRDPEFISDVMICNFNNKHPLRNDVRCGRAVFTTINSPGELHTVKSLLNIMIVADKLRTYHVHGSINVLKSLTDIMSDPNLPSLAGGGRKKRSADDTIMDQTERIHYINGSYLDVDCSPGSKCQLLKERSVEVSHLEDSCIAEFAPCFESVQPSRIFPNGTAESSTCIRAALGTFSQGQVEEHCKDHALRIYQDAPLGQHPHSRHRRGGTRNKANFAFRQSKKNLKAIMNLQNSQKRLVKNMQDFGTNQARIANTLAVHVEATAEGLADVNKRVTALKDMTIQALHRVSNALVEIDLRLRVNADALDSAAGTIFITTVVDNMIADTLLDTISGLTLAVVEAQKVSAWVAALPDLYSGRAPTSLISPLMIYHALEAAGVRSFAATEQGLPLFTADSILNLYATESSSAIMSLDDATLTLIVSVPILRNNNKMQLYDIRCLRIQVGEVSAGLYSTMDCHSDVPIKVAYSTDSKRYVDLTNHAGECTIGDVSYCKTPLLELALPKRPSSTYMCAIGGGAQLYGIETDFGYCIKNWVKLVASPSILLFANQSFVATFLSSDATLACASDKTLKTLPRVARLEGVLLSDCWIDSPYFHLSGQISPPNVTLEAQTIAYAFEANFSTVARLVPEEGVYLKQISRTLQISETAKTHFNATTFQAILTDYNVEDIEMMDNSDRNMKSMSRLAAKAYFLEDESIRSMKSLGETATHIKANDKEVAKLSTQSGVGMGLGGGAILLVLILGGVGYFIYRKMKRSMLAY